MHQHRFLGRFQIWSYTVSHAQLHIRSPPEPGRATQIDVLFLSVEQLDLPTAFSNLLISEKQSPSFFKEYELRFEGGQGRVVAGNVVTREWDGHHNDPHPWESK